MDLKGKKILVTRAKAQASALSLQIKQNGGIPVEMPLITCKKMTDSTYIHDAIDNIHTYDWIVFTSKNGIEFFMEEWQKKMGKVQIPSKIAVVGKKTEDVLAEYGLKADLLPELFVAESLLESLLNVITKEERVLIPRGNLARDIIPIGLREQGIFVQELTVYETTIDTSSRQQLYKALVDHEIDLITFTSSSTVDNYIEILEGTDWRNYIEDVIFVSIGPITSKTMLKHELPVHIEAKEYTIQGMVTSIMEHLKEEK